MSEDPPSPLTDEVEKLLKDLREWYTTPYGGIGEERVLNRALGTIHDVTDTAALAAVKRVERERRRHHAECERYCDLHLAAKMLEDGIEELEGLQMRLDSPETAKEIEEATNRGGDDLRHCLRGTLRAGKLWLSDTRHYRRGGN